MGALLSNNVSAVRGVVEEDIIARRASALAGFHFLSASYSLAGVGGRRNKLASVYVDYTRKDLVYSISANDNHFVEFTHRQWSAFCRECSTLDRLDRGYLRFHYGNDLFRVEREQRFGKSFISIQKESQLNGGGGGGSTQSIWLTVEEFERLTHLQAVLGFCGEALVKDITLIIISIQKIYTSGGGARSTPPAPLYWWYRRLEKEVSAQLTIAQNVQTDCRISRVR